VQPELVVGRRRVTPREWLEGGGSPDASGIDGIGKLRNTVVASPA